MKMLVIALAALAGCTPAEEQIDTTCQTVSSYQSADVEMPNGYGRIIARVKPRDGVNADVLGDVELVVCVWPK